MIKKKFSFLIFVIIGFLGCESQNIITIYSVDSEIETPYRIDGSNFMTYFKEEVIIRKKKSVNELLKILSELESQNIDYKIDTRCILIIKTKLTKDTLFMDRFHIKYHNKILIVNDKLKNLIWK